MPWSTHAETYAKFLLENRDGYPLWNPAPPDDLPGPCRDAGVEIGDVGIISISKGSFDPLFNICKPASHEINLYHGVPVGFETLSLGPSSYRLHNDCHQKGTHYCNKTLQSTEISANAGTDIPGVPVGGVCGVRYSSTNSEGAALVLPDGADRVDVRTLDRMTAYTHKHAKSWFAFAAQYGVPVEDLYLITGVDKAQSWGVASYSSSSSSGSVEFQFSAFTLASAGGSIGYSWNRPQSVNGKVSKAGNDKKNQAVFLRGFSISKRLSSRAFLKSSVHVELLDGCDEDYYPPRRSPLGRSVSSFFSSRSRRSSSRSISPPSSPNPSTPTSSSASSSRIDFSMSEEGGSDNDSISDWDDTEVDDLAPTHRVNHPGQIINRFLLDDLGDDVDIVITHDEDWFRLDLDLAVLFNDDRSEVSRVLQETLKRQFKVKKSGGTASLKPRRVPKVKTEAIRDKPSQRGVLLGDTDPPSLTGDIICTNHSVPGMSRRRSFGLADSSRLYSNDIAGRSSPSEICTQKLLEWDSTPDPSDAASSVWAPQVNDLNPSTPEPGDEQLLNYFSQQSQTATSGQTFEPSVVDRVCPLIIDNPHSLRSMDSGNLCLNATDSDRRFDESGHTSPIAPWSRLSSSSGDSRSHSPLEQWSVQSAPVFPGDSHFEGSSHWSPWPPSSHSFPNSPYIAFNGLMLSDVDGLNLNSNFSRQRSSPYSKGSDPSTTSYNDGRERSSSLVSEYHGGPPLSLAFDDDGYNVSVAPPSPLPHHLSSVHGLDMEHLDSTFQMEDPSLPPMMPHNSYQRSSSLGAQAGVMSPPHDTFLTVPLQRKPAVHRRTRTHGSIQMPSSPDGTGWGQSLSPVHQRRHSLQHEHQHRPNPQLDMQFSSFNNVTYPSSTHSSPNSPYSSTSELSASEFGGSSPGSSEFTPWCVRTVHRTSHHPLSPGMSHKRNRSLDCSPLTVDHDHPIRRPSILRRSKTVYQGSWKDRPVAVKVLSPNIAKQKTEEMVRREIEILQRLSRSRSNILPFLGSADPLVVSPFLHDGNLRQYLDSNLSARPSMLLDVRLGMDYLRKRGIIHDSLNSANILIRNDGTAYITDVGMVDVHPSMNSRLDEPEVDDGFLDQLWNTVEDHPFAFHRSTHAGTKGLTLPSLALAYDIPLL